MISWNRLRRRPWFERATRLAVIARWTLRVLLLVLIVDLFYMAATWPDWKRLAAGPVPKSNFMLEYERERAANRDWPRLRWQPVALAHLPRHVLRAVIVAEDSRFYEHSGFDLIAFREAMEYNWQEGRLALGASTISQQTAKNLYLSGARTPWRKWHELLLTWGMEQNLSKTRILELYLNVAELGQGIYGVQAAAQAYWGVDAAALTPMQAAELAATLPSPVKNNPATRTRQFESRARKVFALLARFPGDAAAALAEYQAQAEAEATAAESLADADDPGDTGAGTVPAADPAPAAPAINTI